MASFDFITKAVRFVGEVKSEGKRVTWPSRKETVMTAVAVFVLAAIAAVFFVLVDSAIHTVLKYFHVVS
ncbi:MAG: preprotein translocase subunit SecE [Proteobacteria bacterium]|nr:preprotein translocase subunit SecE [Pseudomonadota bacterium]